MYIHVLYIISCVCVQEFISYGLCNIAGAFFSSFNSASCFSRTLVQVSAGGKTQVHVCACRCVLQCGADCDSYLQLLHVHCTVHDFSQNTSHILYVNCHRLTSIHMLYLRYEKPSLHIGHDHCIHVQLYCTWLATSKGVYTYVWFFLFHCCKIHHIHIQCTCVTMEKYMYMYLWVCTGYVRSASRSVCVHTCMLVFMCGFAIFFAAGWSYIIGGYCCCPGLDGVCVWAVASGECFLTIALSVFSLAKHDALMCILKNII